jgi:hypothetical protein
LRGARLSSGGGDLWQKKGPRGHQMGYRKTPRFLILNGYSNESAISINEVVRHKARLVLRGYEQVPSKDYGDTYAPTVRSEISRLLLSLTAKYDWECD